MIDYIITNREIHPRNIIDVRTLTSADIRSGHVLVLAKINLTIKPEQSKNGKMEERLNIESLKNDGTKHLYENRLTQKLNIHNLEIIGESEECWKIIKESILQAAWVREK